MHIPHIFLGSIIQYNTDYTKKIFTFLIISLSGELEITLVFNNASSVPEHTGEHRHTTSQSTGILNTMYFTQLQRDLWLGKHPLLRYLMQFIKGVKMGRILERGPTQMSKHVYISWIFHVVGVQPKMFVIFNVFCEISKNKSLVSYMDMVLGFENVNV